MRALPGRRRSSPRASRTARHGRGASAGRTSQAATVHTGGPDSGGPDSGGPDARLAGFEVLGELGRGGETVTYRVRRGDAVYAMKVLQPGFGAELSEQAFRREAALLACVDHPGVAKVHEVGTAEGRPYLVMDLVEGRRLTEVLADGPLPPDQVSAVGLDVGAALGAAHRAGLVHRDVKPDNIVVGPDGHSRVIDFGLAARSGDTGERAVAGTLLYCAPEQSGMLDRPIDGRADLYALGAVLYECATGAPPFVSADVGELLRMHVGHPVPDPRSVRAGLPSPLSLIICRLLAKDPDDRYQSSTGLLADLRRSTADTGSGRDALGGFPLGTADEPVGTKAEHRLVGRDRELAVLTGRWAAARRGAGGIAVIEGPPGIGKSRLARALTTVAAESGAVVLAGAPLAAGGGLPAGAAPASAQPLAALRSAIDRHVEHVLRLADVERAAAVQDLAAAAGPSGPRLAEVFPTLGALLGVSAPAGHDHTGHTMTPRHLPRHAAEPGPESWRGAGPGPGPGEPYGEPVEEVAGFLTGLATVTGGAILHLDDAQWLDDTTRRVLAMLVAASSGTPLLVVVTARDDAEGTAATAGLRSRPGVVVDVSLRLDPLGPSAVTELIAAASGGLRIDEQVAVSLASRCHGNPFTILEYLTAVVDAGLARPAWGRWLIDSERLQDVEPALDAVELVLGRLDGLDEEGRFLLGVGALIGDPFTPELIAEVCSMDQWRVLRVVDAAARRRLVERRDDGGYGFLLTSIRTALLARFDEPELRAAHERIANVLEHHDRDDPAVVYALARHSRLGASDRNPARVWRACAAAGRLALADRPPQEALTLLEAAADAASAAGIAPGSPFLRDLGAALHRVGRCGEALAALRHAYDGIEPEHRLERAQTLALIAEAHGSMWSTTEQAGAAERALEELGRPLPRRPWALLVSSLWLCLAGTLVRLTRLGYGTARGKHKDRLRLLAALHATLAQAHARRLRPGRALLLTLRLPYPVNRLGRGAESARMHMTAAHLARLIRLSRLARRAEASAEATAAALDDPQLSAQIAGMRALDRYGTGIDQGEAARRVVEERARHLDVGQSWELLLTLLWDTLLRGDLAEAERLSARLEALDIASTGHDSAGAALLALQGRAAEAAARLQGMRASCGPDLPPGERVDILHASMLAAVELNDIGTAFDDAVAEFDALELDLARLLPAQRGLYVAQAYGRLEQCRTGSGADLAGPPAAPQVTAARAAVDRLRRVGRTPLLRAHYQVARASLLRVSGAPEAALRALNAAEPCLRAANAPLVAYEAARVRAYALRALRVSGEADRQAQLALTIATTQGWPHRARRLAAGFGLDTPAVAGFTGNRPASSDSVALDRYRQRLHAVQQIGLAASRVLDPGRLAAVALDEIIRILGAERAFLFLIDEETARLVPWGGTDTTGRRLHELTGYSSTLVERVRHTQEPLVVTGSEEGAVLGARSVAVHGLRSIMVAPLQLDGRLLGVVYLDSRVAKGIFTEDDVAVLVAITGHVAMALQTARAAQLEVQVATANRRRDLAEAMRAALSDISGTLEPEQVLFRLTASAAGLTGGDRAWLLLAQPGESKVRMISGPSSVEAARAAMGTGVETAGWDGTPLVDPDPPLQDLLDATMPVVGGPGAARPGLFTQVYDIARSWMAIPLHLREDRLGILLIAADRPDAYDAGQPEVAAALAGQAMVAYENARLFAQVHRLATIDGLTGVANRRHFMTLASRELSLARRHGRPLAAMMIDIDHFKSVNDRYGHQTGDEVIQAVASRLCMHGREENVVGRYGGEEFAIVLPAGEQNPDALAERLRATVSQTPVVTGAGLVEVTVSIGVGRLRDEDRDLNTLLARADDRLYQAKQAGRNRVVSGGG